MSHLRKTSGDVSASFRPTKGRRVTTAISHYSFGGLRFAVKRGAALHHLHGDHLGSTSLTTDTAGATTASRAYYAYGAERSSSGTLQTDRTFTGQKRDATGLMYYYARYYDPALGTFVSPDSLVPDPGMVIDYNRFLYVRGNPLKYADPTGRDPLGPEWIEAFKATHWGQEPTDKDLLDRLISLEYPGRGPSGTWNHEDWVDYTNNREKILVVLMKKDPIGWLWRKMKVNAQSRVAKEIAGLLDKRYDPRDLNEAYNKWKAQVADKKPWDFKADIQTNIGDWFLFRTKGYRYDIWANIHYGYVGRAIGFGKVELRAGAGYAQLAQGTSRLSYALSFFDDPIDQAAIRLGMALYDSKGLNVTKDDLIEALTQGEWSDDVSIPGAILRLP